MIAILEGEIDITSSHKGILFYFENRAFWCVQILCNNVYKTFIYKYNFENSYFDIKAIFFR